MPKQKTNKSLTKRLKITGTGKVKRRKCGLRHLNAHMSGDHKRTLGGTAIIETKLAKRYIRLMGGL